MLYVFNIVANQMNWQKTSFALAGNQTVILTASGTWGVIDPAHRGQCGPAGNGVTGTGDIIAPGAKEGALLCRTADGNVVAFPESCTVTLRIPGPLEFIANDYTSTGAGFSDNFGSLIVNANVIDEAIVIDKAKITSLKDKDSVIIR